MRRLKCLLTALVMCMIFTALPVYAAPRVVADMEVLSGDSARVTLSWSDTAVTEPIRMTGWSFDGDRVKITYQTGTDQPTGFESQVIKSSKTSFPMKMMLHENGHSGSPFTDLTGSHEAFGSVMNLYARGIISGYPDGTFKGDNPVTRTEFSKMLMTTAGYKKQSGMASQFLDVADDFWGKDYIMTLADKGIIKGKGEGTFDPGGAIKLGEVLAVITRSFDTYGTAAYKGQLSDHWSNEAYLKAVKEGIVLPEDDFYYSYDPEQLATRVQCAKLLSRVLEQLHEVN